MPFLVSLTWQTLIEAEPISTPTRFLPSPMAVSRAFVVARGVALTNSRTPPHGQPKNRLPPSRCRCSKRLATRQDSHVGIYARHPKGQAIPSPKICPKHSIILMKYPPRASGRSRLTRPRPVSVRHVSTSNRWQRQRQDLA